jgi:hypothetical protein
MQIRGFRAVSTRVDGAELPGSITSVVSNGRFYIQTKEVEKEQDSFQQLINTGYEGPGAYRPTESPKQYIGLMLSRALILIARGLGSAIYTLVLHYC